MYREQPDKEGHYFVRMRNADVLFVKYFKGTNGGWVWYCAGE